MTISGATARVISLEGLPRLSRPALDWTRRLARVRAGFGRELTAALRGLGNVTVSAERASFFPGGAADRISSAWSGEAFAVAVDGHTGSLIIERPLALRIVTEALGVPSARTLRQLGRTERGILVAYIAAFLEAAGVGPDLRLSLDPPSVRATTDQVAIDLRVAFIGFGGYGCLELPVAALPLVPRRSPAFDPPTMMVTVSVEIGRTAVPVLSLASAAPGDGIAFEGLSPASHNADWSVQIRFDGSMLLLSLDADGILKSRGGLVAGPTLLLPMSHGDGANPGSTGSTTLPDPLGPEAARVLAGAPVEVVAEIGRVVLRGDELVGMMRGGVLSLGSRRTRQVQLRVGERIWAVGELVTVDDELGVRILEILP